LDLAVPLDVCRELQKQEMDMHTGRTENCCDKGSVSAQEVAGAEDGVALVNHAAGQ
jgi:hypothetical protein